LAHRYSRSVWTEADPSGFDAAVHDRAPYVQRQIAEGFFNEPIEDWWEPWMKKADEILDDEELIETVYEALRRRHPQSASARWGFFLKPFLI
jgi:hypothetical protein